MSKRFTRQTTFKISLISGMIALEALFLPNWSWSDDPALVGFDAILHVELETYYVVDGRPELDGVIRVRDKNRLIEEALKSSAQSVLHIRVNNLSYQTSNWEAQIPLGDEMQSNYPFVLPISQLSPGYNRLAVTIGKMTGSEAERVSGKYLPLGKGGSIVDFAILEKKNPVPKPGTKNQPGAYPAFVVKTVDQLMRYQSCRLGGKADGVPMVTIGGKDAPTRRHLARDAKGAALKSQAVTVQGVGLSPEFYEPYGIDLGAWKLLDRLSRATGNPEYARLVTDMVEAFVPHGFDPESGLGYMGEEAQLDVFRLVPVNRRRAVRPLYKHGPDLPMGRLWRHAPEQMSRMSKAMYYGLITDSDLMSYNRFCDYGFDDRARKPLLEPNERHGAFESAAGGLIQWWGFCFARTGDQECLEWARRMADKWKASQNPRSGLVPYVIQVKKVGSEYRPKPSSNANTRGSAKFAMTLLKSADEFRKRPEGVALAEQLTQMGLNLARGVARFGYDSQRKKFRESLKVDGTPISEITPRFFSSQTEKDRVIQSDPDASLVPVYNNGESFYLQGPYWRHTTGLRTPGDLALVARMTKDPELLRALKIMAEDIVQESQQLTSEFTPQGKWTFFATGLYLKMMVALYQATGDDQYLQWAQTLADQEIDHLNQIIYPEWWRVPGRNDFLDGILQLYLAIEAEGER